MQVDDQQSINLQQTIVFSDHRMFQLPILSFFLIFLVLLDGRHCDPAPAFGDRSFSIKTSVSVFKNKQLKLVSKLDEHYSFEQRRARIDYNLFRSVAQQDQGLSASGVYYYDSDRQVSIVLDNENQECSSRNQNQFYEMITRQNNLMVDSFSFDDLKLDEQYKFVIGPARALLFALKKLFIRGETNSKVPVNLRNMPCFKYTYTYRDIDFDVYFTQKSIEQDQMPMPISIEMSKNYEYLIFEYSQVEFLGLDGTGLGGGYESEGETVQLDPFIYKLGIGCQDVIDKEEFLFADKDIDKARFSFNARIERELINQRNVIDSSFSTFVAYDAPLGVLRFDRSYTEGVSGTRKLLYNFIMNRMYHVIERVARKGPAKGVTDIILDLANQPDDETGKGLDDNSQIGSSQHCIVSEIYERRHKLPINELLLGSSKFAYMGRASVRGIQARVYESKSSRLPFWLDNPIVYKDMQASAGAKIGRWSDRKPELDDIIKTIVYIAEDGEADQGQQPILMLEIEKYLSEGPNLPYSKVRVSFFDFIWNLDNEAPNGDKLVEFFSLKDECSAEKIGSNQHAKIELILETDELKENDQSALMASYNLRNFAILATLQDKLNMPATMVYNLESRIQKLSSFGNNQLVKQINSKVGSNLDRQVLKVSFRVADHTKKLVYLFHFGRGVLRKEAYGAKQTRSFSACFLLAAHRRADVYFAYNPMSSNCYVDKQTADFYKDETNSDYLGAFKKEPAEGFLELYMTNHKQNQLSEWFIGSEYNKDSSRYLNSQLPLYDMKLKKDVEFRLVRIDVDKFENKAMVKTDDNSLNDGSVLVFDESKLPGYGLIADDANMKLVKPMEIKQGEKIFLSEMTFDQCHAVCVSDFNCKSFSICVRSLQTECIISNIRFDMKSAVKQLNANGSGSSSAYMLNKRVVITLEGQNEQQIELLKHSTCELYNKNYVDLFVSNGKYGMGYVSRQPEAVDSIDKCAEECVRQNLMILRKDLDQMKRSEELIESVERNENLLRQLYREHREVTRDFCKNIYFLKQAALLATSESFQQAFSKQVKNLNEFENNLRDDKIAGYCFLVDSEATLLQDSGSDNKLNTILLADLTFDVEFFYEKQYGLRLGPSSMTRDELDAIVKLRMQDYSQIDDENFSSIKSFIARGENIQQTQFMTAKKCASYCFYQKTHLWPACKSFDIVMEIYNNYKTVKCILNTVTMRDVVSRNKTELIEHHSSDSKLENLQQQIWHYEPRLGFAFEESKLAQEIQVFEEANKIKEAASSSKSQGFHAFGAFVFGLFGIITGLLIAFQFGQKVVNQLIPGNRQTLDRVAIVDTRLPDLS